MRKVIYFWIIHLMGIYSTCSLEIEDSLIIPLDDGTIQGVHKTSFRGRRYSAFEGIPYAAPPIGDNRFKDPKPVEKWNNILLTNKVYTCIQQFPEITGTEDCLYVNVYTPRNHISKIENLDVVVHIHGGAFTVGNGVVFSGPSKIMDRDIVYVTFNYRLGALGFLATEDNTFSGNYGLKDQVMALRWVQKNINKFGGNPDSVTLTGLSAGAASVNLHYLTNNKTEVLFHRAWAESGSALDPWVVRDRSRPAALKLIKHLGCYNKDIGDCMRRKSAHDIVSGMEIFHPHSSLVPLAVFGPVIEEQTEKNPHPFLVTHPYELLKSGQFLNLPIMFSQATHEGMLTSSAYYHQMEVFNKQWNTILPLMLEYSDVEEQSQMKNSESIRTVYLNNEDLSRNNFDSFIKVCSERQFHMSAETTAKLHTKISSPNTYFMLFGYDGPDKTMKTLFNIAHLDGAMHAAENPYLYDISLNVPSSILTEDEIRVVDILLDFLTSFAKTGIPSSKDIVWDPIAKDGNLNYLFLKNPFDVQMNATEGFGDYKFWSSLDLTYNIYGI